MIGVHGDDARTDGSLNLAHGCLLWGCKECLETMEMLEILRVTTLRAACHERPRAVVGTRTPRATAGLRDPGEFVGHHWMVALHPDGFPVAKLDNADPVGGGRVGAKGHHVV